jgi:hypothetical protein
MKTAAQIVAMSPERITVVEVAKTATRWEQWQITFNGHVVGDSRKHGSREAAIREARYFEGKPGYRVSI